MKKLLLALFLASVPSAAMAECNGLFPPLTICGNTSQTQNGIPTAIPFSSVLGNIALMNTHILVGNVNNIATDVALSGDATISNIGALTNLKVNGVAYPASPSTNTVPVVTSANQITYTGETSANTANTIMARDGSGNVAFGTATGSLTGLASLNLPLTGGTLTGPLYINQGSFTPSVAFPNSTAPLGVNESATGTCTTGANNCYFNFLNISSDNAVVGPDSSSPVSGIGFLINHKFGGSAMTGNRIAAAFQATQTATTGNTIDGASYTGLAAYSTALANDNGTGVTSGTASGGIEAFNAIAQLGPSATNFSTVKGAEIDMVMQAGSSAYQKVGFQIAEQFNDAVQGSSGDVAFEIANQSGAVGWNTGIQFGGLLGVWPFKSTGTAITCVSCGTIANFIDMSGATISGYDWKFANATLSGTGTYTGAQMALTEPSTTANNSLSISATSDASGANIKLTGNGATTPSKTIRVISGSLQILNNAYSAGILALSDTGDLSEIRNFTNSGTTTLTALTTAGLVTTTSGGLLGSEAAITPAQCPVATTGANGCVKPDGTTITISGGVISAATGGSGNVTGTGTSVVGNLPKFSNTSTTGIVDSGVPYNAIPAANSTFTAPGTGGVAQTVQARMQGEYIDFSDYGADCTGTTDSTTAFTNAFNEAQTLGVPLHECIGTIKVNITSPLSITSSMNIGGGGRGLSWIENTSLTGTLFSIATTAPIYVHDIGYEVSGTPTAGAFITDAGLSAAQNVHSIFDRIECSNAYYCLYLASSAYWNVDDSIFLSTIYRSIYVSNTVNSDAGDSEISNSQFLEYQGNTCATTGVAIFQASSGGLRIIGNKFNCGSVQYNLQVAGSSSISLISGNSFENCATHCIYITNTSSSFTWANVTITGNEISPYADINAIYIQGTSGWLGNASISGNTGVFAENSSAWARVDYATNLSFGINSLSAPGTTSSYALDVSHGTVTSCHQVGNSVGSLTTVNGTCTNN